LTVFETPAFLERRGMNALSFAHCTDRASVEPAGVKLAVERSLGILHRYIGLRTKGL
jgi:hypothetical protein